MGARETTVLTSVGSRNRRNDPALALERAARIVGPVPNLDDDGTSDASAFVPFADLSSCPFLYSKALLRSWLPERDDASHVTTGKK
jgi:hypothetical protein